MSHATDNLTVFIGCTPAQPTVTKAVPYAAGGLRGALSAAQPGNWSSDHRAESSKYVGWHYVAARAIALQASQATATVYDDRKSPTSGGAFSSFKSIRAHYRRKHGSIWKAVAGAQNEEAVNVVPDEHPLARLYKRPNPWQSGGMERYEMMLQLALTGVLLIWKVPNAAGKTVERYVIPTAVCQPQMPSKSMPNGGYRIDPAVARAFALQRDPQGFMESRGWYRAIGATLPIEAFITVRWPNPLLKDDGQSPVSACALWSDCADMVDRARWAHLKNGANPSLMVTGPEDAMLEKEDLQRLAAELNEQYAGPDNVGKTFTMNYGSKAEILGTTPKDMVYDQGFMQMRDAILAVHGTPGIAAGITDGGSYAAFYASLKQFVTLTVQPQLSLIAEEETVQQAQEFGEGYTVEYEAAAIDDPTILENSLATDIAAQARTKNEHRAVRGLPPNKEWGDEIVGTPAAPKLDPNAMLGAGPGGPGAPGDSSVAAGEKADPFEGDGGDSVQQGRGASAGLASSTLDKLQAGKISEARALATLRMLGLSSERAAALVADAKDGQIDEPANKEAAAQADKAEANGAAEKPDESNGAGPAKKPKPFDKLKNGDDDKKKPKKPFLPKSINDRMNGAVSFGSRFGSNGNGNGHVDSWLSKAVEAAGRRRSQRKAVSGSTLPTTPLSRKMNGDLTKNCGANAPGGGGFQEGNTCAKGTDGTGEEQPGRNDATAGSAEAGAVRGSGELRGSSGLVESPREAAAARPLVGLPQKPITIKGHGTITPAPFATAREAAESYMKAAGLPYNPPTEYAKVDQERATKIAAEYDKMENRPDDPEVKRAYSAMIKETMAQWEAVKATGLHVEFIPPGSPDPYAASPRLATEDVRNNNHLWVFPTVSGFGSSEQFDASKNPLLADTGEVINGHHAVANDVFRIVHDYFGHIKEGNGFRADGEENAWRSHSAMFSREARRAMTTETRGQNSWVNFGPYGKANRSATSDATHYADQKVGLLPEWVTYEGSGHDEGDVRKAVRPLATWRSTAGSLFKACGANAPGGGGFQPGNTCARGGDGEGGTAVADEPSDKPESPAHYKHAKDVEAAIARGEQPVVHAKNVGKIFAKFAEHKANVDITEIKVHGTLLFGGEGLGVARIDMPQLGDEPQKFYDDLKKDHGIETKRVMINPMLLMPIQKEISGGKAGHFYNKMVENHGKPPKPITVTRDRYVVDGHHTWGGEVAYALSIDSNVKVPVDVIDTDHETGLKLAREWSAKQGIANKAMGKTIRIGSQDR